MFITCLRILSLVLFCLIGFGLFGLLLVVLVLFFPFVQCQMGGNFSVVI